MKLTALKTQDLAQIPVRKAVAASSNLTASVPRPWKFYIGEGNNGELVRRIINETRGGAWQESKETKGIINFKWQQNCKDFKFERMTPTALYKQIVNHFEFHREISTKAGLFKNLRGHCEVEALFIELPGFHASL